MQPKQPPACRAKNMEYVFLFFFGWMVVCLPAIIFTAVANSRRRRETAELNDRITALSRQLAHLEQRSREGVLSPQSVAPSPAMKITTEEARGIVPPQAAQPPKPAYEPVSYPTPPPPPPAAVAPPVA